MEMKIFGKVYQLPLWLEKTLNVLRKIGSVLKSIAKWIYRLRGFFMAIPVVLAALYLATKNMARLPDEVGINLLANGQYEYLISRGLAVMGPLVITGVCLVMMFLSRRTVFPWLISIFSLVLPLLIYITNVFPA
ncbi:MAG: hypothetical protein IIW56_01455 [Oscillospiraceae bacterium]|jgi:hypothetical protein|nr:hypothetical protein [Oscillospiraceae bacterium]